MFDGLLKRGGQAAVQRAWGLRPITKLLRELSGFHALNPILA
jgi:hypothetical protein